MSGSTPAEPPLSPVEDLLVLNRDIEKLTESVEDMKVRLTWMTYDIVALRTSPELVDGIEDLRKAYQRCKVAVFGDPEPGLDNNPGPVAPTVAEK